MSVLRLLLPVAAALALGGCATIENLMDPVAPKTGDKAAFVLTASGVQQFQCTADAKGRYWRFIAPEASLVDAKGRQLVRQGSDGSFFAEDGSMLASKIEKYSKESSPENIRDLLYKTSSRGKQGILTGITHVKRSNGKGGMPLTRCSPSQLGQSLKVPFTATYTFYRGTPQKQAKSVP